MCPFLQRRDTKTAISKALVEEKAPDLPKKRHIILEEPLGSKIRPNLTTNLTLDNAQSLTYTQVPFPSKKKARVKRKTVRKTV